MARKATKKVGGVEKAAKLETTSYKGVRDFYPQEMFLEKYVWNTMRRTAEDFGYVEYGASILEPADLYRAKTGEEIVNEQTYTFKDRGDREVTLRPEMTPTVARMIAAKRRELSFPLRWYAIPNLFRYEQPQRGRLREHFQFNADIFGVAHERAEIEIVSLAYQLLKNLGAKDADFEIRVSDRNLLNLFWETLKITPAKQYKLTKLIDKKDKISADVFKDAVTAEAGKKAQKIIDALASGKAFMEFIKGDETPVGKRMVAIIDGLTKLGVANVVFTPSLVRGLDYYTGFVFEIFDKDPANARALFGGGRYDNLLEIFGTEPVPAVGFGAGDVTLLDFMDTHKLLPKYASPTQLFIAVIDQQFEFADIIAEKIRDIGGTVAVDYTDRSIGDRIKKATAESVPFFAVIGKSEVDGRTVKLKNLETRAETQFSLDEKGIIELARTMHEASKKKV